MSIFIIVYSNADTKKFRTDEVAEYMHYRTQLAFGNDLFIEYFFVGHLTKTLSSVTWFSVKKNHRYDIRLR